MAEDLVQKQNAGLEVERLFRLATHGALSTLSVRLDGWPFGSVVPYAVSREGEPIILIAGIAQHTKNIHADDRVSLLVQPKVEEGDPQAEARLTLLGRARPISESALPDARARYLARLPVAASYFQTHDFDFFRLALEHVRYIGGFGQIHWLTVDEVRQTALDDPLAAIGPKVVAHMNDDHQEALKLYCQAYKDVEPQKVLLKGVDTWGFDIRADEERFRFDFAEAVEPQGVREAFVTLVKDARQQLSASKIDSESIPR